MECEKCGKDISNIKFKAGDDVPIEFIDLERKYRIPYICPNCLKEK